MKPNHRLQIAVLLLQVAFVIGAFATQGAVSVACWVIFALLFVAKWIVMFRAMGRSANGPGRGDEPPEKGR